MRIPAQAQPPQGHFPRQHETPDPHTPHLPVGMPDFQPPLQLLHHKPDAAASQLVRLPQQRRGKPDAISHLIHQMLQQRHHIRRRPVIRQHLQIPAGRKLVDSRPTQHLLHPAPVRPHGHLAHGPHARPFLRVPRFHQPNGGGQLGRLLDIPHNIRLIMQIPDSAVQIGQAARLSAAHVVPVQNSITGRNHRHLPLVRMPQPVSRRPPVFIPHHAAIPRLPPISRRLHLRSLVKRERPAVIRPAGQYRQHIAVNHALPLAPYLRRKKIQLSAGVKQFRIHGPIHKNLVRLMVPVFIRRAGMGHQPAQQLHHIRHGLPGKPGIRFQILWYKKCEERDRQVS